MKRLSNFLLTILSSSLSTFLFISNALHAQPIDTDPSSKAIDGISNIAASIAADSFAPMTHYNDGSYIISIVPAYFTIQNAYDDPEIKGNDLKGCGGGAGLGYATSDRTMFYAVIAYMHLDGKLTAAFYKGLVDGDFSMKVDYSIISLYTGIGYDLIESHSTSLPLFAGIFIQKFDGSGILPKYLTTELSVDSSSSLFGISLGIAPSYKFKDMFKITPYYLFSYSINEPYASAKIVDTSNPFFPISTEYDLSTNNVNTSMVGLSLTWLGTKLVSVSLSLGGWMRNETSWYNETFLNGLQMKSAILVVSFSN